MTFEEFQELIAFEVGAEIGEIVPNASLKLDLGADEEDIMSIVMEVEDRYGIQVDDDFEDDVTVQQLYDYLTKFIK